MVDTLVPTKVEKLFSTPLLRFSIDGADALNASLLEEGAQLRSQTEGVSKSNRGGWHSPGNLFDSDAPCVRTLRVEAEKAIYAATAKVGAKADVAAFKLKIFAWMNANPPGGFNAPHTHPGAHWSGVYYVSQPQVETGSSGKIEFLDPRTDLPNWRLLKAPAFSSKKAIRPMPGDMILFPSYLVHWVYPNDTAEERVTIAFNATFQKRSRTKT